MKQHQLSPSKKDFEQAIWSQDELISGIDEVGRGCLAGPVVACCTVLFPHSDHPFLVDSKILTETKRGRAAAWIKENSWYSFGVVAPSIVDEINIYQATKMAMRRAFFGLWTHPLLPQKPSLTLIDAVPLDLPGKVESFPKGESRSISIAAASILAKVYRDELITRFDTVFPGYAFAKNKGYGAQVHRDALKLQGSSLVHRKSFIRSFSQQNVQQSLF